MSDSSVPSQKLLRDAVREKSNTGLVEILSKGVKILMVENRKVKADVFRDSQETRGKLRQSSSLRLKVRFATPQEHFHNIVVQSIVNL